MVTNVSTVLLEAPFPSSLPCFELRKTFQYLVPWVLLVCLLFFHRLVNLKTLKSSFYNNHGENGIKICLYIFNEHMDTHCVLCCLTHLYTLNDKLNLCYVTNSLCLSLPLYFCSKKKKGFDGFNIHLLICFITKIMKSNPN